jgi:hypothetical protein
MSGLPVSEENLTKYNDEFKASYDTIMAEHGPDMLVVHQKLLELDKELQQKWQRIESFSLPKSAKGWRELIEAYKAPIMVAVSAEEGSEGTLVLVIMDQPLA